MGFINLIKNNLFERCNVLCFHEDSKSLFGVWGLLSRQSGFYLLGGGGGGEASLQNVFLTKKNLKLFQIKIFFDDDFKESVKVTNVQKCNFSQS